MGVGAHEAADTQATRLISDLALYGGAGDVPAHTGVWGVMGAVRVAVNPPSGRVSRRAIRPRASYSAICAFRCRANSAFSASVASACTGRSSSMESIRSCRCASGVV